jgi:hypothetical protein
VPPRPPPRAARRWPSIRPSRAPQPKVGMGEGPPRCPLRFPLSPAAAAPGALPAKAARPPPLSGSGGRGGRRKGIFAHTPCPFPPFPN